MPSLSCILRRSAAALVAAGIAAGWAGQAAATQSAHPQIAAERAGLGAAGAVYAARGDAPIWMTEDRARAEALLSALRGADAHGLPPARYAPDRLEALMAAGPAAEAEIALSRAYLLYARDISSGLLEPRRAASNVRVQPERPDPAALLSAVAAAPDMAAHLAALQPSDPDYARLVTEYAALRAPGADWGAPVETGRTLRLGDNGPRVAALRARLAALGDLAPAPESDPATDSAPVKASPFDPALFDAGLAEAVRAFQRRHGLNADAVVGPRTYEALNASLGWRIDQIAVNLERMRWLNRPLGHRRIIVNQADFTVTLFEGDAILFRERVIVGQPRHQTVEFSDEMEYLVLNPTWHVPRSIATEELLPQLQEDPTLLARRNMTLARNDGGPLPLDPSSHDFTGYTAADFPYRIRQRPNNDNALGRVKFMFPNDHAIYLHDTPTRRLFAKDRRTFSHGCVRVQDPLRLAELLLAPQEADPRGFIDAVLATGRERYVNLIDHVPVHLTYRTAWVDEDGIRQFRDDVYGRDAQVRAALAAAGVATHGS
jgi:murein L,D-transpeptidase YcbB/YkuD